MLDRLIAVHRNLYADDTRIDRLVARQPPTSLDLNTGILHEELATQVGMNMSGRLLKYVSHPEGYGADFPWSKGWWLLRGWCRRNHRYHMTPPHWRGALCWQLVNLVVVQGFSVQNAAQITQYDNPEPLLRDALEFIEKQIDKAREKQEYRAKEDAGMGPGAVPIEPEPPRFHLAFNEFHVRDCHRCHSLEERLESSCRQCRRANAA